MTIDKDLKSQKIRLVGGLYADTWFNWTGEGSFVLRARPPMPYSPEPSSQLPEAVPYPPATDYTIRFVTIEGEKFVYAAPREWTDQQALRFLFKETIPVQLER